MTYRIKISPSVIEEDLKKIPGSLSRTIYTAIENRIAERPYDFKPLRGRRYRNIWRLRVGDYRIAYRIAEEENTVYILCIDVRGKIYDRLDNRIG